MTNKNTFPEPDAAETAKALRALADRIADGRVKVVRCRHYTDQGTASFDLVINGYAVAQDAIEGPA